MTNPGPRTPAYGYIHWRSTLTGKEGGGTDPVEDPAAKVAILNERFPDLHHWFIPA
jgi:hypothetical protein